MEDFFMVAKRGDLKPVDEWEESIRNNAKHYTVVGFQPGKGNRHFQTFDSVIWAKAYAQELMKNKTLRLRTAMVYAVGQYDNFALVGSVDTNLNYKEVIPKRW